MIGIIDINSGNLVSVLNKISLITSEETLVSNDLKKLKNCNRIIFPGVGNIKYVLSKIESTIGIKDFKHFLKNKDIKFLGICVGAQVMGSFCEEAKIQGLGLVKFDTLKLKNNKIAKVPHVGWNKINIKKNSKLFDNIPNNEKFYFTHSYCMRSEIKDICLTTTFYNEEFISSFSFENIYGVQFHPEKSHEPGLQLLKNFIFKC